MPGTCIHEDAIRDVTPSARGCEECLKTGSVWVHRRLCRTCGHVGCCDSSPNRHATKHFHATGHPVIEGYDPPEGWGWCYVDEVWLDLSDRATRSLADSTLRLKLPATSACKRWEIRPCHPKCTIGSKAQVR